MSFDKPWEHPEDPIIAARPSARHPGGTVYFYAKHPPVVVYGGGGAAYRANSPGLNVPRGETERADTYYARVEEMVRRYAPVGAVGYTESSQGKPPTGQIVFRDAAAAKAGYQRRLDEINAGSRSTSVLDVLTSYNGHGNPHFRNLAIGAFKTRKDGFGDQSALLRRPYASLTPDERATVVNKGLRAEGYDNPAGTPTIEPLLPPGDQPQPPAVAP